MISKTGVKLLLGFCLLAAGALPALAQPPADPVRTLVQRLDLEKYKATIKALTRFGDRRQGTALHRSTVGWFEARLKNYGCSNSERLKYQLCAEGVHRVAPAAANSSSAPH